MKTYEIDLCLVSPCISSGAEISEPEFRAPSIRGALRHWFRVLGGTRDAEEKIFGGINAKTASRVVVRVKSKLVADGRGADDLIKKGNFSYFLGIWGKNASERKFFPENRTVKIQIIDKSENSDFEKALKAWLMLGAIGSRSRRCFGSIYPEKIELNGNDFPFPKNLDEFKKYLNECGLKNATVLSLGEPKSDAFAAMNVAQDYLKKFRCGKDFGGTKPSKWGKAEHDWICGKNSPAYRAVVGLPLEQRYSNGRGTFKHSVGKNERWASPVCLKVVPLEKKFVAIAIFLKDYFLKKDETLEWKEKKGRNAVKKISHDLIDAMMKPEEIKKVAQIAATVLFSR